MKLQREASDRLIQKREASVQPRLDEWRPQIPELEPSRPVNVPEALVQLKRRREEMSGGTASETGLNILETLPVQRAGGDLSNEGIQAAAAEGIRTPSTTLPFIDRLQPLFGHHDLSGIKAHVGEAATASASAAGAQAFATGDHVVFAGAPDLHTAAHEAAHVVQQRGGVQLAGGVGQAGDEYERHADAVADRVVSGQSAEDVLDERAGGQRGAGSLEGAVQRRVVVGGDQVMAPPPGIAEGAVAVLQAWIADAAINLTFQSWAEAVEVATGGEAALAAHRAVQWLRGKRWQVSRADIVDPALTSGNCHGLTFGGGGGDFIEFDSIQALVDRWNARGRPNIIVCLDGEAIAHTGTFAGGVWRQTLPGGPVFVSDTAALQAKYECHILPAGLAPLQAKATRQLQAYQALWQRARTRFQPATQVAPARRTEAQHYMAAWFEELEDIREYSAENMNHIHDLLQQADELEGAAADDASTHGSDHYSDDFTGEGSDRYSDDFTGEGSEQGSGHYSDDFTE